VIRQVVDGERAAHGISVHRLDGPGQDCA
jgi:hypothetical protein